LKFALSRPRLEGNPVKSACAGSRRINPTDDGVPPAAAIHPNLVLVQNIGKIKQGIPRENFIKPAKNYAGALDFSYEAIRMAPPVNSASGRSGSAATFWSQVMLGGAPTVLRIH